MIIFFISLIAIGLAVLLYYKSLALAPIRIVAIILLYILITGFILSFGVTRRKNPPVVLTDYSASMARYTDDIQQAINEINFTHTQFYFGETLSTTVPEGTQRSSRFTNIAQPLKQIGKTQPAFIVLVSDGNHNYGHFPFSEIKELNTPVYCFGVGSEKPRDVAIVDVRYPAYAFVNDSIKIEVVIESQGFTGGRAQVVLRYNKKEQKKSFLLNTTKAKTKLEFSVNVHQPEQVKVFVDVARQPEELSYKNNKLEFPLRVLPRKTKVIYFTEHLSFNTKFMLRTRIQEDYIDLIPLARIDENTVLNLVTDAKLINLPGLDDIDVIILDNVHLGKVPWRNIEESLKKGMGLLCVGSIQGHTALWNDILPINTTEALVKGTFQLRIKEPFSCFVPGVDYPPLSAINRVLGVKDKAIIIAQANNVPIIAYHNYGTGTVFQINGIDIGTWQFLQLGLKQKDLLAHLLRDVIRFLSPIGKNKRLFLNTLHRIYNVGETITLKLQSYDQNYRLAGGGDFFFEFDNTEIPFFETGKGMYQACFISKKAGDIFLQASGKLEDEELTSNTLEFTVSGAIIEIDQGLNKDFLQTLASETGGEYFSLNELAVFELPLPENVHRLKTIDFDSPISYFLIFVLLAIDWIIRRRRGII